MKISQANKLYHLTSEVVKYAVKHGMIVCVENPQFSLFWATTFWISVAKLLRYTIFHSCQYGSNRQKKTMLAHNHKAFNQLSKLCPGESKKHRHLPWGVTPAGHFATSEETAYPIQLARDVAQCFTQALVEAGMKLPPSQLQDMTSSSEAVLQAVRAQSGLQPKHSKLPPLVTEFATIIAVEVAKDTPSSQPPHSQIPQHSKFLSSAPLVTAPVKGGGDECRPSENSANDRIVQKWGVYHTPDEFVRKAAQAGHPLSLETCLPEVLKRVLISHENQTSIARIKKRTVVMRDWVKRAENLKDQEHELKSKLDPHAKHILSNKRILLWKSLLEEHNYPDMPVVNELLEGTSLIGETDTTGLWPAKFVPATVSEIELYEISTRERESICSKVKDTPSETDKDVWHKTLEEVDKGWLVGPFDPKQIPVHYPLSRRFGVVQGEKTRCVDDFSRSHVNSCVQVTEAPKPHTVDVLASLLMQAMTSSPNTEEWCVRTLDLKDAYRQCAISTSSFPFSHIVVREPSTGLPKVFKMLALPFGSIKSVHAFLRIAHSLWFLASCALDVMWTNYFDDYVCCCARSEANHLSMTIHAFFHLLGWSFAETGSKAVDFDIMCKALGVNVDVSSMRQGTVLIDNTEARKKELGEFIDKVVSTKKLSSVDALKLRGRMQFTAGQLFGRVAKTCLARVTNHAYRSSTSEASDALISSLILFKKFLLAQKPRAVTAAMLQTWLVFTDASFEQETESIDKAGFGGVLVSPQGKYVKFFSFELKGEDLVHLNPAGKKTAIFQCEFFAVLVALELWGELLSSRQVVFYIDNDGVRDVLISCNTSDPVGSVLLTKVLEKESACAISSWFTRVPSKSNVADDPSRGEIDQLVAAQAQHEQVEPVKLLKALGPVA